MSIHSVVDLSGVFGAARSQGDRRTCMAFAMSDLNRFGSSAPDVLSAEFLYQSAGALTPGWQPNMGLRLTEAIRATAIPGQPLEMHFPYQANNPLTVATPAPPRGQSMFSSLVGANGHGMRSIVDQLSTGRPVGLVLRLTPGFFQPPAGIVPWEATCLPDQYHAVLAVGWGKHVASNEQFLFIRNSWGVDWALSGHAWLPAPFVAAHVIEGFGY